MKSKLIRLLLAGIVFVTPSAAMAVTEPACRILGHVPYVAGCILFNSTQVWV